MKHCRKYFLKSSIIISSEKNRPEVQAVQAVNKKCHSVPLDFETPSTVFFQKQGCLYPKFVEMLKKASNLFQWLTVCNAALYSSFLQHFNNPDSEKDQPFYMKLFKSADFLNPYGSQLPQVKIHNRKYQKESIQQEITFSTNSCIISTRKDYWCTILFRFAS